MKLNKELTGILESLLVRITDTIQVRGSLGIEVPDEIYNEAEASSINFLIEDGKVNYCCLEVITDYEIDGYYEVQYSDIKDEVFKENIKNALDKIHEYTNKINLKHLKDVGFNLTISWDLNQEEDEDYLTIIGTINRNGKELHFNIQDNKPLFYITDNFNLTTEDEELKAYIRKYFDESVVADIANIILIAMNGFVTTV